MAITSDGNRALIGCSNGWTFVRDLVNKMESTRERGQPVLTPAHRLILREDDTCWAACGRSDVIYVARIQRRDPRAMLRTKMEEVFDIAFSPDGRHLLAGGRASPSDPEATPLSLWDVDKRKRLRGFKLPGRQVTAVAYSPDATRALAACAEDDVIRLIALEDGREITTLGSHSGRVNMLAFLPDGRRAVSASDDTSVRLWSLQGSQIRQFEGHIKPVRCVDVSSDGRYLLSGGMDGLCCIWEIDTGRLVMHALPGVSGIASALFRRDSRFVTVLTRCWSLYQWRVPTVIEQSAAEEPSGAESPGG